MRNAYFDPLSIGTEVFVAGESDYSDPLTHKLSRGEQLYYHEMHGTIIKLSPGSRPRYRGYVVRLDDGSVVQHNVGLVRLPDETYTHDDNSEGDPQERLDAIKAAHLRPERPRSSQPGVAEFTGTRRMEGDR